jgi:hypothetical protein
MPTNRKRRDRSRLDELTDAQEAHLRCGHYFFDFREELDHFRDEAHRRRAWALHRERILAEYAHPGHRPLAFWEYDAGSWENYGTSEPEAVHRLLEAGEIEGCRFNGVNRIVSELEVIEANWRREIKGELFCHDAVPKINGPLPTWGTPVWYYRQHAPRILAELKAEEVAWKSRNPPVSA